MKWFAAAILAVKDEDNRFICENRPVILQAPSTQAAKKICLWIAKRRWPKKDNWSDHQVSVIAFPKEAK